MPPQEITPSEHSRFIERIEKHPYFAVSLAAILLLIIGVVVVLQRSSTVTGSQSAWGGAGGITIFGNRMTNTADGGPQVGTAADVSLGYIPLPGDTTEDVQPADELAKLLALISQPAAPTTETPPTEDAFGAYSYVPTGLITAAPVKTRTPAEEELYKYGNRVGSLVQPYEDAHRTAANILKDHAEDRENADKIEGVKRLGTTFAQLGYELERLDGIPESAQSAHNAYATTYRILGTNLIKLAEASDDEAFLDAVTTYNESSDALTKRFLALVALFTINNVTFSSSDAGSMFVFSPSLSL